MSTYCEQYYWYLHACAELAPNHKMNADNLTLLKNTILDFCHSNNIEQPNLYFSGFINSPQGDSNTVVKIIFPDQSCLQIQAESSIICQLNKGV